MSSDKRRLTPAAIAVSAFTLSSFGCLPLLRKAFQSMNELPIPPDLNDTPFPYIIGLTIILCVAAIFFGSIMGMFYSGTWYYNVRKSHTVEDPEESFLHTRKATRRSKQTGMCIIGVVAGYVFFGYCYLLVAFWL